MVACLEGDGGGSITPWGTPHPCTTPDPRNQVCSSCQPPSLIPCLPKNVRPPGQYLDMQDAMEASAGSGACRHRPAAHELLPGPAGTRLHAAASIQSVPHVSLELFEGCWIADPHRLLNRRSPSRGGAPGQPPVALRSFQTSCRRNKQNKPGRKSRGIGRYQAHFVFVGGCCWG